MARSDKIDQMMHLVSGVNVREGQRPHTITFHLDNSPCSMHATPPFYSMVLLHLGKSALVREEKLERAKSS
jgi:hypothetical protein